MLFDTDIKACDISRFDLFLDNDGELELWDKDTVVINEKNKPN